MTCSCGSLFCFCVFLNFVSLEGTLSTNKSHLLHSHKADYIFTFLLFSIQKECHYEDLDKIERVFPSGSSSHNNMLASSYEDLTTPTAAGLREEKVSTRDAWRKERIWDKILSAQLHKEEG